MIWLAGFALGAQVLAALLVAFQYAHAPDVEQEPLPEGADARNPSRVLAIVPARNEEKNIEACVAALVGSSYRALRVLVVDDGSTDRTAELAREWGAVVVSAG